MNRSLLAAAAHLAPELTDVRRFRHDWEKTATLALRGGAPDAIGSYAAHDRIHDANDPLDHTQIGASASSTERSR